MIVAHHDGRQTARCDVNGCGSTGEAALHFDRHEQLVMACLPDGWRNQRAGASDLQICPAHVERLL